MKILVTGSAGFIGYHFVNALIEQKYDVTGIDSLNDYYDVNLKLGRLAASGIECKNIKYGVEVRSNRATGYNFIKLDITDNEALKRLFDTEKFDVVCNLAAQAGVRYSLTNPQAYLESNIQGFLNILECCRHYKIKHLMYASSSSVYGLNKALPFSAHSNVDHPVSLYAASKKSNELMAHTYSHLFNLPTTGLRFFTVYGSWGRPDMAIFLFTKAIVEGKAIKVFNKGNMKRDFTHVSDIVGGMLRIIDNQSSGNKLWDNERPDPASSSAPYKIFNIGRGKSIKLTDFIYEIEKNLGKSADKDLLPMQDGDVEDTWADIEDLRNLGYQPKIDVNEGVPEFTNWYKMFYNI